MPIVTGAIRSRQLPGTQNTLLTGLLFDGSSVSICLLGARATGRKTRQPDTALIREEVVSDIVVGESERKRERDVIDRSSQAPSRWGHLRPVFFFFSYYCCVWYLLYYFCCWPKLNAGIIARGVCGRSCLFSGAPLFLGPRFCH